MIEFKNDAPEGFMRDAQGRLVPTDKVRTADILENDLVLDKIADAYLLNLTISHFKKCCFNDIKAMLDILAEQYNVKKGGKKGNLTLQSYDGRFKIMVSVADFLDFGPNLQIAKQLIDECIHDWSDGTNDNIRALVDHAFRVDKSNQVNTKDILGLRRLDIKDDKWQQAMTAIADSIRITSSKEYVRFYYRPSPESDWQSISLDIAKVKSSTGDEA